MEKEKGMEKKKEKEGERYYDTNLQYRHTISCLFWCTKTNSRITTSAISLYKIITKWGCLKPIIPYRTKLKTFATKWKLTIVNILSTCVSQIRKYIFIDVHICKHNNISCKNRSSEKILNKRFYPNARKGNFERKREWGEDTEEISRFWFR
jgi:hypothetical protein